MSPEIDFRKYKLLFWAVFAGAIVSAYSLAPQFQLWALRGHDWTGVYAIHDFDEPAYAAYIQSLIDGKPRRNSPYTGREDSAETPQKESLFSIQFLAFYPAAIGARILGLSSSTAMIFFSGIVGFLAGLALFWVFYVLFDNPFLSFAGTILVFSCGALAAGQGIFVWQLSPENIYYFVAFPFARRAVPLVGFPALFLFFGFVWKLISSENRQSLIFPALGAVFSFTFLVYSYFYLWTSAAAWLGGLILLQLAFRFEDLRKTTFRLCALAAVLLLLLIPYFILLANRSQTMDSEQLMVFTRHLDLLRVPEILSFTVLAGFAAAKVFGLIDWREPKILFLMSFALVAPIVFNQQILTGRSLQPVHYQFYAVNYIALFAAVSLAFVLLLKTAQKRIFGITILFLSLSALYVGYSEGQFAVKRMRGSNDWRNDLMPVAEKIKESSKDPGENSTALSFDFYPYSLMKTKFSLNASDELPALSSQLVLWSPHQKVFSDLSAEENTERLFKFIYYQNFDEAWLADEFQKGSPELLNGFFGWGRNENDILNENGKPVGIDETNEIVERYKTFRQNFNREAARKPEINFVVIHEATQSDLSAIDKWYERDAGEKIGKYILYRVKLRNP